MDLSSPIAQAETFTQSKGMNVPLHQGDVPRASSQHWVQHGSSAPAAPALFRIGQTYRICISIISTELFFRPQDLRKHHLWSDSYAKPFLSGSLHTGVSKRSSDPRGKHPEWMFINHPEHMKWFWEIKLRDRLSLKSLLESQILFIWIPLKHKQFERFIFS